MNGNILITTFDPQVKKRLEAPSICNTVDGPVAASVVEPVDLR